MCKTVRHCCVFSKYSPNALTHFFMCPVSLWWIACLLLQRVYLENRESLRTVNKWGDRKRWYYVPLWMELLDPCVIVLVSVFKPWNKAFHRQTVHIKIHREEGHFNISNYWKEELYNITSTFTILTCSSVVWKTFVFSDRKGPVLYDSRYILCVVYHL